MKTKYIWLLAVLLAFTACQKDDNTTTTQELPELTAGTADFSTYVSIGNSLTSGFTDGALFMAAQQNSFPNTLATQFALVGGGAFTQPLMNDNFGGMALNGNRILEPRLVTTGGAPQSLESVIGPVTVTTDLAINNPSGPFNNMGVPGAASFHLIAPGYGNIANFPAAANPYFIRMTGSAPDATVMDLATAQAPTFVSLWIGNNDVLGYALAGGDATAATITPQPTFDFAISTIMSDLAGTQGVMANIPYVTTIPHFTTVPYNPLDPTNPDFGSQIPTLNTIFGALNQIFAQVDPSRIIVFSEASASPVVIVDESLTNLSATITGALLSDLPTFEAFIAQFGLPAAAAPQVAGLLGLVYGQARQATAADLLVLPSASIIGTVNQDFSAFLQSQNLPPALAAQFATEGVTLPLADKWVLIPSEQDEIKAATDAFNTTLKSAATAAGYAFVDANGLMQQLDTGGFAEGNFILTSDLVTGGAFGLDGVHPTARGYALIANQFLKAIDATYGSNFEASGNLVDIGTFPTNYSPLLQ